MSVVVDEALSLIEVYCERRVSPDLREQIRIECSRRGNSITIVERRPPWKPDFGARYVGAAVIALDPYDTETERFWRERFGFRRSATPVRGADGAALRRLWQPLFPES